MKLQIRILWIMLVLLSASISFAQDLKKHQWKDRLLLIIGKDSTELNSQIQVLQKDISGLKERKLIVYKITPKAYQKGIKSGQWIPSEALYKQNKNIKESREVILIGLDGGVKLRQTKLLTLEQLFTLIDGMPMRRNELRTKNKSKSLHPY